MKKFLLIVFLMPILLFGQTIALSPNNCIQGESLQVFISGAYSDLGEYSNTTTYGRLVYSDYSNTSFNISFGSLHYNLSSGGCYEYLDSYDTDNAPSGYYHFQTRGYQTDWNWQTLQSNAFYINEGPDIIGISPSNTLVNESFSISIIGDNTNWNSGVSNVRLTGNGSYYASSYSVISDNLIIANFNSIGNSGIYDVQLYDYSQGQNLTLYDSFEVLPDPQVVSINPNIGLQGQTLSVVIGGTGSQFYDNSATTSQFRLSQYQNIINGNVNSSGSNYISGEINIPHNASLGFYDVEVYDYSVDNWVELENGFQILEGNDILSVVPNSIEEGQTQTLSILHNGINPNSVYLSLNDNTIYADSWSETSSSEIEAIFTIPLYTEIADWDLIVRDSQFGPISLIESVNVSPSLPTIYFSEPTTAFLGSTVNVTISGYNTEFLDYSGTNASFYYQNENNIIYPTNSSVFTSDVMTGFVLIPDDSDYIGDYDLIVNDPAFGTLVMENTLNVFDGEQIIVNINGGCYDGYLSIEGEDGIEYFNYDGWNEYSDCTGIYYSVTLPNNQCYNLNPGGMYISYSIENSLGQTILQDSYDYILCEEYLLFDEPCPTDDNSEFCIEEVTPEPNPEINWVSPSSAYQGDDLSVSISGSNIDFYDCYEQWSDTYCDYSTTKKNF